MTQEVKTIDHLKWLWPNLEIIEGMGHTTKGTPLYGVYFEMSIFHTDLEKFNQCGLEIHHIKAPLENNDYRLLIVVYERRAEK